MVLKSEIGTFGFRARVRSSALEYSRYTSRMDRSQFSISPRSWVRPGFGLWLGVDARFARVIARGMGKVIIQMGTKLELAIDP